MTIISDEEEDACSCTNNENEKNKQRGMNGAHHPHLLFIIVLPYYQ